MPLDSIPSNVDPALLEELRLLQIEDAIEAQCSLAEFVRQAWHIVEPARKLLWNWHLDLICEALERVTRRELRLLVICVPPGTMKSLLVSVFWPAWEWLSIPWERSLFLSGSNDVRIRDSRRCREVISSDWYQRTKKILSELGELRGEWQFAHDQNQKVNFANTARGNRQSHTCGGKITGRRADKQVVDDPYDVDDVIKGTEDRIAERMQEFVDQWDGQLVNRLNDMATSPRVLIMQMLHSNDVANVVLERHDWSDPDKEHIVLAAEYDPESQWNHPEDPRTEEGELLFEALLPLHVLESLEPWVRATQYNQKPTSKKGKAIKREWMLANRWRYLPEIEGLWIQVWDLRAGGKNKKTSSFAVGQLWFRPKSTPAYIYLVDQVRGKPDINETIEMMQDAQDRPLWGRASEKLVENRADGQAALTVLRKKGEITGLLEYEPVGHKDDRPEACAPYFKAGNVLLRDEPWVDNDYIPELASLPGGKPDDQGDCTFMAIDRLLIQGEEEKVDPRDWLKGMVG